MRRISISLIFFSQFGYQAIYAQGTSAVLNGTVVDEKGAVLPSAGVSVLNESTGLQREATSNSEGYFAVSFLPPGHYIVRVKREGFNSAEIKDLVLQVGDQRSLRISLSPAGPAESITVVDDASLVHTSPAVSTVIDRQFIENLPMNGRSFQSLIVLTPGVVLTRTGFGEQGQFSVNGQRSNANYFTVDGVSANIQVSGSATLNQTAGGSIPGTSASGGTSALVSIDALQEFRIQTSTYAAEFGRTPGAQVSIVTRSGTNQFHGTMFEYFRDDALDANDWFNNSRRLAKPVTRQHDFGGVVGGPILLPRFGEGGRQPGYDGRNHTFFFFSYEALRLQQPQSRITQVPSLATRQSAVPQVRRYLDAYPLPNGPNAATGGFAEFAASYSDPTSSDATSLRVDHTVGSKLTLFGRVNYSPSSLQTRAIDNTSVNTITIQGFKTVTATVGATWLISPRISNELLANWSSNKADWISQLDNFGGAVPLPDSAWFPASVDPQDSLIVFGIGGSQSSFYVGKNVANHLTQFNLVDSVSLAAGPHQAKFGIDYRRLLPELGIRGYAQFINFNQATGLASGRTHATTNSNLETWDPAPLSFTNLSVYGQDTWKATQRITLTYGLRWEVSPPPTPRDGKQLFAAQGLENPATMTVVPGPLYKTRYANFAPRVGVAFGLSQRAGWESVIRGGFGIFYDLGNGPAGNVAGSFPNSARAPFVNRPYPLSESDAAPPVLTGRLPVGAAGFRAFDANLELPRTYQWNLTVEQSLGARQTLSASYVAAVGRKLLRVDFLPLPLTVNPNLGANINVTRNTATSDYHALQLQFQRRLARGFQALSSYTWSHSIDNASSDASSFVRADLRDPQTDRGDSDFDVRHSFTAGVTYNLPKTDSGRFANGLLRGWAVDSIVVARSATPVNLTTGTANLLGAQPRPNVDTGIPLYLFDPSFPGGKRINNSIIPGRPAGCKGPFCPPTPGQQGSLGRNALRGFPAWQVDLTVRRQFNFTERFNLQFRVEMFNVFNHPNFGFGDAFPLLNQSSFGQADRMLARRLSSGGGTGFNPLYQVGGPRSIQLALKFHF
ncbi:MAG: TonB-dependent receptor [Pyrinomonadaceae bacterium]|nr:TonB-dependent receptor [Pyrinomonadaceae bacterium]